MTASEIVIKGDVEVLRLQPGDAIIVNLDLHIGTEATAELRRRVTEVFPGHRVVVMSPGIRLAALREDAA